MPLLVDLKVVTSSSFDIGVYLVVIGLGLDVLRSLGAELDRQGALERADRGDGDAENRGDGSARPSRRRAGRGSGR